jgi:hypothetical protein
MIVVIKQGSERAVFHNVGRIQECRKPSGRKTIELTDADNELLVGADDIDLTGTEVYLLPNPEGDQ